MTDGANKRKDGPGGSDPAHKKSKGGSAGRWQTPHQKARQTERSELGRTLEVNDVGIWVTYARGMKGKAMREFKALCDEYGESLFGVKPPNAEEDEDKEGEEHQDIEASIQQELAGMVPQKPTTKQVFTIISTALDCVFFMKTMKPVEPLELVARICQDAKDCPDPRQRKVRYINRLTPVFDTDRATDKGIERVTRSVLAPHFQLKSETGDHVAEEAGPAACTVSDDDDDDDSRKVSFPESDERSCFQYAIRHTIRNHTAFKSSAVIKMTADLIKPEHKVNLTSPDKVVLVEIFQTFCGVSVVDGKQWEELKRYNINELYKLTPEKEKKSEPAAEGAVESK
ncbi:hypothetical protein FZEAL_5204 [Fusarium zealandicum]|uniref:THUMP domain-containing protein n=1 Tax=Fusarium zealandicum TaxID=1053134 RepID=A0A8H4UL00_9HYPO|nr:hypothetical protein FZEAL_5204 [Fusarium zealandicum]